MPRETIYKIIISLLILALLGAVIFIIAIVTQDIVVLEKGERPKKIIEIDNAHITGRQDGKKIWEIWANHAWSPLGERVTNFEDITNGLVFQKDRLLIRNVRASKIKVYRSTDDMEMFGSPTLEAEVNLWESRPNQFASLETEYLKYKHNKEQTQLLRKIKIQDKDEIILANRIVIDNKKNTAKISGNLKYQRKNLILRGEPLLADLEKETISIDSGFRAVISPEAGDTQTDKTNVSGKRLKYFIKDDVVDMKKGIHIQQGKRWIKGDKAVFLNAEKELIIEENVDSLLEEDTYLKSKYLSVSTENKDAIAEFNVTVNQPGKLAFGNAGKYEDKTKTLTLSGNVKAVFEKGRDLIDEKTAKKITHSEAKKALKEKTLLFTDTLAISTENKNAYAKNNVKVSQKGQTAKADSAEYDDEKKTITLTDNVYILKESTNEWIKTEKVVVDVENEVFEAQGRVQTEFILKKQE